MMPTLVLAVHAIAPAAGPVAYPNARLLAEPADLGTPAGRAKVHLLDARDGAKFAAGHIPGAAPAPFEAWGKAILAGRADAAFWRRELAAVGVTPGRPVVVYGDDVRSTCRGWWVLKYAGVGDVRVLNGRYEGQVREQLGAEAGVAKVATANPHDWTPEPSRHATKADVLAELMRPTGGLLDARSRGEFTGADPLKNKKAGCVPGAVHLEWSDLLEPGTGRFLPPDRLAKLLADRKVDLTKPQVSYCQGGGRAAVVAFGLELMGAKEVRNYYASWGEWGNADDTPVAVPGR